MKTRMPVSTISFNSAPFLALKLRELTRSKLLEFWFFVVHKPEDDEGGKKQHIHLYAVPAKTIQTEDLRTEFLEPDPSGSEKPLGCLPFKSSKFADAYLYFLHNKAYLASKGQTRKFHYAHNEIITSDSDFLLAEARSIDMLSVSPYADMMDAIEHGISWEEYFSRGLIPIPQIKNFRDAFLFLSEYRDRTFRNGRDGHSDSADSRSFTVDENGEILP